MYEWMRNEKTSPVDCGPKVTACFSFVPSVRIDSEPTRIDQIPFDDHSPIFRIVQRSYFDRILLRVRPVQPT